MSNEIQDDHPTNSKDNSDRLSKAKKLIYLRKMNKILFYFKKMCECLHMCFFCCNFAAQIVGK